MRSPDPTPGRRAALLGTLAAGAGLLLGAGPATAAPPAPRRDRPGAADRRTRQAEWRWCHKCQSLSYGGNQAASACPAGGTHDGSASANYLILHVAAGGTQSDWRWCHRCQGMFYGGATTSGYCPVGGGHDRSGSHDYRMAVAPGVGQSDWRWCRRCQGMFFGGGQGSSRCPAGGTHDGSASGDYVLEYLS
ncbi:hypothetical protein GCM10010123_00130 [Pilimelia anulata]|uniref:Uncharacterized protein n=1 Tax=Pilimelia anulata TaxID=53371 RepID=A0A8J3AY69_9ACTN|nr:hypothetical protein [Pilimelia anulata]GGJ74152.1 hypothetical protein GCM10010123_00130 [Pilimelia anulata]